MWDSGSSLERGEKTHAADDALRLARRRHRVRVDGAETVADEDLPQSRAMLGPLLKAFTNTPSGCGVRMMPSPPLDETESEGRTRSMYRG